MKFLTPVLLVASAFSMTLPVIPSLKAVALPSTGIEQFPSESPTTFPVYQPVPIGHLPQVKAPWQPIDAGSTYIATPRTITITPGGNPQPWRDSSGRFAGSNPFGSSPRNSY